MTRRTAVSPLLLARIFGLVAAYLPSLLAESGYRQLGGGIAPSPELVDGHSRRALRSAPPVPPVGSTTTISCQVQFDGLALSDRFEPAGQRDFNTLDCVCVRLRVSSDQLSTEGVMSCVIWGALPALLVRYSCYSRAHGGTRTDDSARSRACCFQCRGRLQGGILCRAGYRNERSIQLLPCFRHIPVGAFRAPRHHWLVLP